ncbi:MAG: glycosyltransferase family 2 protein [Nocardioidaceae bacterium]
MTSSVTVVIATRDRPEMMREALASVLEQDYAGPVEVILVFDQAEPELDLATEADPLRRVVVTTNGRSPGLAGARNTGITASQSDYVAFLDDDDLWLPGKLGAQVALLDADPEAVLATTGIVVDYDGERHPRVLPQPTVGLADLLRDRHTELHPSTFVARRSALLGPVGLVDQEVPGGFGEDYDLLLRAAKVHPILNVTEPLTRVRWGAQSFFFRRWPMMAEGLTWMLARHPEFASSPRGSARIRGQIAFAHAAMGHRREALRWAATAVRRSPVEPRVPLAVAVALGLSPDLVMTRLHKHGRGI